MAAVTICSNFGDQENKICHCFHFIPLCLPWSDGTRCPNLNFFFKCWISSQLEFHVVTISNLLSATHAGLRDFFLMFGIFNQKVRLMGPSAFLDLYTKYLEFLLFPIISIIPYHEVRSTLSQVGSMCLLRYHESIYNSAGYILFAPLHSFLHHSPLCSVH